MTNQPNPTAVGRPTAAEKIAAGLTSKMVGVLGSGHASSHSATVIGRKQVIEALRRRGLIGADNRWNKLGFEVAALLAGQVKTIDDLHGEALDEDAQCGCLRNPLGHTHDEDTDPEAVPIAAALSPGTPIRELYAQPERPPADDDPDDVVVRTRFGYASDDEPPAAPADPPNAVCDPARATVTVSTWAGNLTPALPIPPRRHVHHDIRDRADEALTAAGWQRTEEWAGSEKPHMPAPYCMAQVTKIPAAPAAQPAPVPDDVAAALAAALDACDLTDWAGEEGSVGGEYRVQEKGAMIVPELVDELRERGYQLVPISKGSDGPVTDPAEHWANRDGSCSPGCPGCSPDPLAR